MLLLLLSSLLQLLLGAPELPAAAANFKDHNKMGWVLLLPPLFSTLQPPVVCRQDKMQGATAAACDSQLPAYVCTA
jgi:hypothetical protein